MIEIDQIHTIPNKLGWIFFHAIEDVIGHNGVNAVLHEAQINNLLNLFPSDPIDLLFKYDQLGKIMVAIENIYGPRSGRGLALRTGRACFKYIFQEYRPMLGFTDKTFKLLPWNERINQVVCFLAQVFNTTNQQNVIVNVESTQLTWNIEHCAVCWERRTDEPVCYLFVGLIHEALYWMSSGKHFAIEETECHAKGNASCKIVIIRHPLE